jgi:hypothetical protein
MLARAAGLALDDAALARIEACDDAAQLERWALCAASAKTAAELLDG